MKWKLLCDSRATFRIPYPPKFDDRLVYSLSWRQISKAMRGRRCGCLQHILLMREVKKPTVLWQILTFLGSYAVTAEPFSSMNLHLNSRAFPCFVSWLIPLFCSFSIHVHTPISNLKLNLFSPFALTPFSKIQSSHPSWKVYYLKTVGLWRFS